MVSVSEGRLGYLAYCWKNGSEKWLDKAWRLMHLAPVLAVALRHCLTEDVFSYSVPCGFRACRLV
jgi:hypothetical protein